MNMQLLTQVFATALAVLFYFAALVLIGFAIKKLKTDPQFHLDKKFAYLIRKIFVFLLFFVLLFVVALIWGIDLRGVLLFASSFFAIVGVSLFASWSILSNITAGAVLFFSFPHKVGDTIKIVDGANFIAGEIMDMTLFHVQLKDEDNNRVSYPNILLIQRPVVTVKWKSATPRPTDHGGAVPL